MVRIKTIVAHSQDNNTTNILAVAKVEVVMDTLVAIMVVVSPLVITMHKTILLRKLHNPVHIFNIREISKIFIADKNKCKVVRIPE